MTCRGCGKEIADGEDYRMVAEWPFCVSCFEDLMKGRGKQAGRPRGEPPPPSPPGKDPHPGRTRCGVCHKELDPGEEKKLGIWTFCPDCFQEMVTLPKVEVMEAEETEPGEGEAPAGEADARAAEEKEGLLARVAVGLSTTVTCKGCGRRIRLGGSRTVDGEPFCPDCYYARQVREQPGAALETPPDTPTQAGERELPAHRETHDGEDRCSCCDRPVRTGSSREVDGFVFCPACLATDPELAVRIARQRHARLLDRLRDELGIPKA